MTTFPRALRAVLITGAVAGLTFAGAATASAHVTIHPDDDTAGAYAKLTVRVPNESETAGTTQVRIDLPQDTPLQSVRAQPHPGWTAEVTKEQLPEPIETDHATIEEAVTSVTWTADEGVRIAPGEFDEFGLSVGPLPEPGTYLFPATQTYEDGEVVAWDMEPAEQEPERPAPEVTVTPEDDDAAAGDDGAADDVDTSDNLARGLGIGGVIAGAAGLGVGAGALRRRRA